MPLRPAARLASAQLASTRLASTRLARAAVLITAALTGALAPAAAQTPVRQLPDAVVAQGQGAVARAWLADPTEEYTHGVLGDAIEALALVVEMRDGRALFYRLPDGSVFEDRTVRLLDLDGDGAEELVVVRAYLDRGAAISVFQVSGDALVLRAETPPIGRPNRWRNPIGAADLDGDGRAELLSVTTPHIGGTLEAWVLERQGLRLVDRLSGVSNHAIGSPELDMAEIVPWGGGNRPAVLVPNDRRTVLLRVEGGPLRVTGRASLARAAVGPVTREGDRVLVRMENGRTARIERGRF